MSARRARSQQHSSPAAGVAGKGSKAVNLADFSEDDLKKMLTLFKQQQKADASAKKKKKRANEQAAIEESEREWQRSQRDQSSTSTAPEQDNNSENGTEDEQDDDENVGTRTRKRTRAGRNTEEDASDGSVQEVPQKKAKSSDVEIVIGTPEALKKAKTNKKQRTPVADTPVPVESIMEQVSGYTGTPYTRKVNPNGENKPRDGDFSPTSRRLIEDSKTAFSVWVATQNAFPEDDVAIAKADDVFQTSSRVFDPKTAHGRRADRFSADQLYKKDVRNAIKNSMSAFRGRVVEAAEPLVEVAYELKKKKEGKDPRAKRVEKLLVDGLFAFEDTDEREGFLGNEIVPELLSKSFLTKSGHKKQALGFGSNVAAFKTVPNHLLAFLLTAIHCALKHWSTGVYKEEKFDGNVYDDVYDCHLDSIEQMEHLYPEYMQELRQDIWNTACELAGVEPTIVVHDDDGANIGYIAKDDASKLTRRRRRDDD